MTTSSKYDLQGAASLFATAHHARMREAYAQDQIGAARVLCCSVLDAAAGRGFVVAADGDNAWQITAGRRQGTAYVRITPQGDIRVSTRQLESPRPLDIRYDPAARTFAAIEESTGNPATALARAIVAALDEGWEREERTRLSAACSG